MEERNDKKGVGLALSGGGSRVIILFGILSTAQATNSNEYVRKQGVD